MKETKDTALPTASALFNPLIKVLGNLIKYNTSVGVVRDTLYDSVLAEAGVDVSTTTHPLKGRTGLYRIVQFAHRNQRDGYCGKKRTALTTILADGSWSLTDEGVILSKTLNGFAAPAVEAEIEIPPKKGPNETSTWLAGQPPKFWNRLESAVAKQCRVSAQMNLVSDHINNTVERWVRRDAFADRIRAGNPPSYSDCSRWAINSAFTDIRGWGRWADTASLRGAKTERERKTRDEQEDRLRKEGTQVIEGGFGKRNEGLLGGGEVVFNKEGMVLDIEDTAHGHEDQMFMDSLIEWSENTLKERMPIAHERYTRILHWLVEGYSAKEIAGFESVSVHRASTMIYDLKALLRKAREEDGI